MDALYHWPTTETFLSNSFRGHARLSVIARRAEIFLADGWAAARSRTPGSLAAGNHTALRPTWPERATIPLPSITRRRQDSGLN